MYLKRLEILGFKTFADRTIIELTPGITAVVGPNGTGKSNIADAILWVLGEQNVRNLRGIKTADVIFAGSDKRKPTGMAEVSLVIDNTSGRLPINYTEVTITRRAYRSGEGEYYINKVPCRLKDIYELFLDTGAGREAYSMVNQGEIDSILSARSEDRRALFEEAAGVKKYRHKRKEAIRKLETTETNLRRVNDIISELGDQLEPLEAQAEVARRYNELVARLREIEIGLLIQDLRRCTFELESARKVKAETAGRLGELDRLISELDREKDRRAEELSELDRQLDDARQADQEQAAEFERLKSRLAVLEERIASAREIQRSASDELERLTARLDQTLEERENLASLESAAREHEERLAGRAAEQTARERDLDSRLQEAARRSAEGKAEYIERAKELAAKRNEVGNTRSRIAELEVLRDKLQIQISKLEDMGRGAARAQEEARNAAILLQQEVAAAAEEIQSLGRERAALREEIRTREQELDLLGRTMAEKSSRLETLREMAEAHEGFFEGVKAVMQAHKSGELPGHFAVVADVIEVPSGFEIAFDVALGSALQDIIAGTIEDARRAIRFLKDNRAGRATFLPLDGIRPMMGGRLGDLSGAPGYAGLATELLRFDKMYAPAINVLLGRTVVMETIEDAVKLARSTAGWNKIVTLDGEVIMPSGAMTGGIRQGRGRSLLARKQEISALVNELAGMDSEYARKEEELAASRKRLADLDTRADEIARENSDRRVSLAEAERQARFSEQEHSRIDGEMEAARAEMEEVETALAAETDSLSRLLSEIEGQDGEAVDYDAALANAEREMEALQAEKSEVSSLLMEMRIEMASISERRSGLQAALARTTADAEHLKEQIAKKRRQLEESEVDAAANDREAREVRAALDEKERVLSGTDHGLDDLTARRAEIAGAISKIEADIKAANRARNEASEEAHSAEVREARLEVQASQIGTRLFEEYEIGPEQALDWQEPVEVERGTAAEVGRLRREIRGMGQVNTGAIAEYERVKERWDFLSSQREDLEKARKDLNRAISEIDDSTKGLFMETFNAVAANFDAMFRRLFGGGVTRLELTNPSDLLETGIEVVVQPPGKKLQNLLLLSGGERALTAAALLFALMMHRPSPFVVLDEVDAALDESNVERFAELLRDFSSASQFIVITHNRATMEAADNLYGVTMQEPGVSSLISVRLAAEEAPVFAEEALASG